jgi:hypothetical protein
VPSLDASAEPIAAQVTVAVDCALGDAYSLRRIGVDVAAPAALGGTRPRQYVPAATGIMTGPQAEVANER